MNSSNVTGRDFIVFGLQPWDMSIGGNCKNIAEVFSVNNRVLYVNRPIDRMSYYKREKNIQALNRIEAIKNPDKALIQVKENLWVLNPTIILESINMLPTGKLYDFFNRRNNKKLARQITDAAKKLGMKNEVLFIDNDFFNAQYLKEFLNPSFFIFYIRDFLRSQQYFIKHGKKSEPALIKKADAVAANSLYLANYASQYNPRSLDVGQGCTVEEFLKVPETKPLDIAAIPYPVIGYCGYITSARLDIDLIKKIAEERKGWNIVLVGPADEAFINSDLGNMQNVYFLGPKSQNELSGYIHAFDVCINPQVVNQMTIGNYPRKVDEYLAAGKPVVATNTESMQMFSENVFLCNNETEYLIAIEQALKEQHDLHKTAQRRAMAMSHTWENSVEKIYSLIPKKQL